MNVVSKDIKDQFDNAYYSNSHNTINELERVGKTYYVQI